MTARRAVDAGMPSWTALLFFVPIVNYLVMGLLAIVPSRRRPVTSDAAASPLVSDRFRSALQGVAAAVAITLATLAVGVYFKRAYSTGLFLGVPFTIGYISAYLYNRPVRRPARESIGLAFLSTMIAAGAMVIFALEGVVCAAMAIPLAGRDRDSRSAPRSGRGRQRGAGRRWWHYAALAVADLARAARRQQGSGCCHDRGDRRGTRNRLA
jgi:hypothetical protein